MRKLNPYGGVSLLVILCTCCNFGWCIGCLDDERRALQEIIDSMGFQSESSLPESYSDDCCQWEEVDCSLTSSHVVRIFFDYAREEEEMWFPDMNLFSQIKELQELQLTGNRIGGLVNPEALCKLWNMQQLDLSFNLIEGDVPSCLANMSSLKILDLSRNRFEGDLSFLSNMSQIDVVDVSHNLFQGLIPLSIFANLSKLSHLDLSYNYKLEVDTESPTWYPSFQIQHLLLAGCSLNHRSNHLIPSFLSSQYSLQTIDLSNNFLNGSFPTWMLYNVSSVLRLRCNSFVGEFPHASQKKSLTLRELDISCNLLDGPLPSTINVFLPKLYAFNASSNQFAGTIPPSFGEMQNLEHLDLSNNRFSGVIPTGLTKNSPFWYLNLSNNSLGGELLPKDCKMTELKWLLLHHNHFVGNLPSCLSNSLSLFLLDVRHNDLSGTVPDQMVAFAELGALLLGVNGFGGYIPGQLCRKQKLHFLDLSNNNFSGSIPSCLSNNLSWRKKFEENSWVPIDFNTKGNSYSYQGIPLTLMTGIDLSSNQLTGTIPVQLGELLELRSLNLSRNLLTGHFPASFQNLTRLDSLDLSHNKLTGHIPPEIGQMSSLGTFNVACNDLSGRIPFEHQLSTFSDSSYIGNPKLCGEPLLKECSDDYSHDNEDDEKEESETGEFELINEPLVFYSFVFVAYAFGFWSVIAPLCLSKNWRRKYYATTDRWMMLETRHALIPCWKHSMLEQSIGRL